MLSHVKTTFPTISCHTRVKYIKFLGEQYVILPIQTINGTECTQTTLCFSVVPHVARSTSRAQATVEQAGIQADTAYYIERAQRCYGNYATTSSWSYQSTAFNVYLMQN